MPVSSKKVQVSVCVEEYHFTNIMQKKKKIRMAGQLFTLEIFVLNEVLYSTIQLFNLNHECILVLWLCVVYLLKRDIIVPNVRT